MRCRTCIACLHYIWVMGLLLMFFSSLWPHKRTSERWRALVRPSLCYERVEIQSCLASEQRLMSSITEARIERWCTSTLGTQERNTGPLRRLTTVRFPDILRVKVAELQIHLRVRDQNRLSTKSRQWCFPSSHISGHWLQWGCELAFNACDAMIWCVGIHSIRPTFESSIFGVKAAMFL